MYYQGRGYTFNPDTELRNNISSEDAMHLWQDNNRSFNNSWQRHGNRWNRIGVVPFINTDNPNASGFLRPKPGSGYEDIGAYASPTNGQ